MDEKDDREILIDPDQIDDINISKGQNPFNFDGVKSDKLSQLKHEVRREKVAVVNVFDPKTLKYKTEYYLKEKRNKK